MSEDIHEIQAHHQEENGKKDYGAKDIRVLKVWKLFACVRECISDRLRTEDSIIWFMK